MPEKEIQHVILERLLRVPLGQLREVLEVMERGSLAPSDTNGALATLASSVVHMPLRRGSKLEAVRRAVVLHAIAECKGNVSAGARLIGMNRKAFDRLVRKYRRADTKTV
jgi:transcriptional regulator of acetoin/glycerol metabolism